MEALETFGTMFYVVSPNKTVERMEDVPDYQLRAVPFFMAFFVLEQCYLAVRKREKMARVNDLVASTSHVMIVEFVKLISYSWEIALYVYIYSNWRIASLPWDSVWTWVICLLSVDFLYYWTHRACHELNFLWAIHQVHHSSEDFNYAMSMRQPFVLSISLGLFYLPLALAIPPSVVFAHNQLNFLYQFWIHTQAIGNLGPLEYILNTASHHRVHHGRNRYCIDKNYSGFLIIWDRMFGTFEKEKEEVVFGLTHPPNTFNMFYIQFHHMVHMWRTFWAMEGFKNKLSVIFKGPGWAPGKPWCGNIEDVPDVKAPVQKYDPPQPTWSKVYMFVHAVLHIFCVIVFTLAEKSQVLPRVVFYGMFSYVFYALNVFNFINEGRWFAKWLEFLRCVSYIAVDYYLLPYTIISTLDPLLQTYTLFLIRGFFLASGIFWFSRCVENITVTMSFTTKKTD